MTSNARDKIHWLEQSIWSHGKLEEDRQSRPKSVGAPTTAINTTLLENVLTELQLNEQANLPSTPAFRSLPSRFLRRRVGLLDLAPVRDLVVKSARKPRGCPGAALQYQSYLSVWIACRAAYQGHRHFSKGLQVGKILQIHSVICQHVTRNGMEAKCYGQPVFLNLLISLMRPSFLPASFSFTCTCQNTNHQAS